MRKAAIVAVAFAVCLCVTGQVAAESTEQLASDLDRARTVYFEEGPAAALPLLEDILSRARDQGDSESQIIALRNIGNCHRRLGHFEESLTILGEARAAAERIDLPLEVTKVHNSLGLLYWEMGSYPPAIENFSAGIDLARELDDRKLEGMLRSNLGLVYDELGHFDRSLEEYERALELYRDIDFPRGVGDTLGNIGGIHLLLGRFRKALGFYEQALAVSRELGQKPSMSQDLGNMAACHLGMGEIDRALELYERALELARGAGLTHDEAYWLEGKANALVREGRYSAGLDSYRASLALYEQAEAKAELLAALGDLGELHLILGDVVSAKEYFQQAVDMARDIGQRQGVTKNLISLGDLETRLGHPDQAKGLYRQAMAQAKEIEDHYHESVALLRLASVQRELHQTAKAEVDARQGLALAAEIGSPSLEAEALLLVADLDRRSGRLDESLEGYGQAQGRAEDAGDPDLLWQVHYGRAQSLIASDRIPEAIDELEESLTIIEGVRDQLREDRFHSGYLQDKYQVYVDLVHLLIDSGRLDQAFRASERLRAKSQLDLFGQGGSRLRTEEDRIREDELRQKIRQLQQSLLIESAKPSSERREAARSLFSQELAETEREFLNYLGDLEHREPSRELPSRELSGRARIPETSEVQALLGPTEALIEYLVSDDRLTALVLTAKRIEAKQIPLAPGELPAKIELLRGLISRSEGDLWRRPAASLRSILITPLEQEGWLEEVETLRLIPHGVLHYLPFAVLSAEQTSGSRLLVADYVVSYLTSAASMRSSVTDATPSESLLAMAPSNSNLRFSAKEVQSIGRLFENPLVLTGGSATEAALKQNSQSYRALHLATHGYFNKVNPMLSGLILEPGDNEDGLIEVHEILEMTLESELVVLSACDTALGSGYFSEIPAGDDFVSLTRAFLSAGSESVLATLWAVDDRSTLGAMQLFYSELREQGRHGDSARALAEAQRQLIDSNDRTSHPYYWAPFVLVGDVVAGGSEASTAPQELVGQHDKTDNRPTGP